MCIWPGIYGKVKPIFISNYIKFNKLTIAYLYSSLKKLRMDIVHKKGMSIFRVLGYFRQFSYFGLGGEYVWTCREKFWRVTEGGGKKFWTVNFFGFLRGQYKVC